VNSTISFAARTITALAVISFTLVGTATAATFRTWAFLDAPVLTSHQRATMRREVERIWSRYGVEVSWHDRLPTFEEKNDLVVTIVVDDGPMVSRGTMNQPVLGEVVVVGNTMLRRIRVSPRGTRQIVNAVASPIDEPVRHHFVHARFIGRVVAHELGHLLLDSRSHAATGLMRPLFDWRDAVKDDAKAFHLEPNDLALLDRSSPALSARVAGSGGAR
jgi:hypothetical protein